MLQLRAASRGRGSCTYGTPTRATYPRGRGPYGIPVITMHPERDVNGRRDLEAGRLERPRLQAEGRLRTLDSSRSQSSRTPRTNGQRRPNLTSSQWRAMPYELTSSTLQGRRRLQAVRIPLFAASVAISSAGLGLAAALPNEHLASHLGRLCAQVWGAMGIALVLPTERKRMRVAAGALTLGLGGIAATAIPSIAVKGWVASRTDDGLCLAVAAPMPGPVPCWWTHFDTACFLGFSAASLLGALRVAFTAVRKHTRQLVHVCWRTYGLILLVWAVLNLARVVGAWVVGSQLAPWLPLLAHAAVQAPLGVMLRLYRVRVRVHAWLAIIGEEMSTARTIAVLIGSRLSAAELEAKAASRLRCITLDRLRFDDLRSAEPDPALYARSVPARIGDVDCFIR